MAHPPPIIQDGILTYQLGEQAAQLVVDSANWYGWLETASTFIFRREDGSFTAHKERAGNRRGRSYWRAYRTRQGQLQRIYLGQSEALTLHQLQSVAARLFALRVRETVLAVQAQGLEAMPCPPAVSNAQARLRRGPNPSFRKPAEPQETAPEGESVAPGRSTLPVPLTSFFGREREVAAVAALLQQPSVRLVTVVGTGGVGKTRLALHLAAERGDTFADGVCFVSLAPVSDPEQVMSAIATALGLWETGDRPLLDQVQDYLREKHLLLLLDNFEQVAAASLQMAALLVSCPRLHLLVTSRAALRLSGEYEFLVQPFSTPDLTQLPEHQVLAQFAAVRLFVERAHAIQPAFQLTQANARTIAEICVRLDGLPLAIELAAARIKLLPPQALLQRLSHRLDLLTGGARDLPTRQQTLRNTLQWSYDLLSREEQRLFRRLSVFLGGCGLEGLTTIAQATAHAGDEDGQSLPQLLEGVASLIDKSLVLQTEQEGEEPRLLLLETVREYGLDCLQAHCELETARAAHAAYYLHLVEEAHSHLFSAETIRWLDRLEREYANIRTAFLWYVERRAEHTAGGVERAARMGSVLWRFWTVRGYVHEGRTLLERVLAAGERSGATAQAEVLLALGTLLWYQSDYARSSELGEQQLALFQQRGDQQGVAHTLIGLAGFAHKQRDYARARSLTEESLAMCRAAGDTWWTAFALSGLGRQASDQGEHGSAQHLLEESQALYRTLGYVGDIAWPLIYLARNAIAQGEPKRACSWLEEAIALCREAGNKWGLAHALSLLGRQALEEGKVARAHALLTECYRLNQELGNRRHTAWSLFLLATAVVMQGDSAQARTLYEQSLAVATALGHRELKASCLHGLAVALTAQAHLFAAARLWGAAETLLQNSVTTLPRVLRAHVERAQSRARTQLGDQVFAQALAEGRTMTAEQVLAWQPTTPPQEAHRSTHSAPTAPTRPAFSPAGLTTREVEVLRLVAQGLTDAQVAERLVISYRTVTTHLSSIYNKLGSSSRAAAARFAAEHQLI